MRWLPVVASVAVGLSIGNGARGQLAAKAPAVAAAVAACVTGEGARAEPVGEPTTDFLRGGLMPAKAANATTVSAKEANCLIARLKDGLVVVSAMSDDKAVPGSYRIDYAGGTTPELSADVARRFTTVLSNATEGDKARPVLVYCHHTQCQLSFNTVLRMSKLGYQKIFWMREGLQGWVSAGYRVDWVRGAQEVLATMAIMESEGAAMIEEDRAKGVIEGCRRPDFEPSYSETFSSVVSANRSMSDINTVFNRVVSDELATYSACLAKYRPTITGSGAESASKRGRDRIAKALADERSAWASGREQVEEDPALYFGYDADRIAYVRINLRFAQNPRTLRQSCGSPGKTKQYLTCLEEYQDLNMNTEALEAAVDGMAGWSHYTCSVRRVENCIIDDDYQMLQLVGTTANIRLMQNAADLLEREQDIADDIEDALEDDDDDE